jgi:alkanesulfonate monooxygenase SsuD/methylene tetrahydromethanopterin reductase-like flavin-dependent oxidoreductase (luciferase family)
VKQAGKASPEGEGNWAKSTFEDLVQYNDGFRTNLIGTPQQIAERIVALKAIGVDLVLTGFLHFRKKSSTSARRCCRWCANSKAGCSRSRPERVPDT